MNLVFGNGPKITQIQTVHYIPQNNTSMITTTRLQAIVSLFYELLPKLLLTIFSTFSLPSMFCALGYTGS